MIQLSNFIMNLNFDLAPEQMFFNFEEEASLLQISEEAFKACTCGGKTQSSKESPRFAKWDFTQMEDYAAVLEANKKAFKEAEQDFNA
jgi:hypothetical protein